MRVVVPCARGTEAFVAAELAVFGVREIAPGRAEVSGETDYAGALRACLWSRVASRVLLPKYGLAAFAYWGHKVLRWIVPFFFLAGLAANAALWRIDAFKVTLGLQAFGAIVAVLAYDARAGVKLPRWTRPVSYFYLMNYSLLCGFIRFATKTQRVTWDRDNAAARRQSGVTPAPSPAD